LGSAPPEDPHRTLVALFVGLAPGDRGVVEKVLFSGPFLDTICTYCDTAISLDAVALADYKPFYTSDFS